MNKSVLIVDDIDPACREVLSGAGVSVDVDENLSYSELAARIKDYNGLVVRSRTTVDERLLESAPNLEIIGRSGVGIDNITARDLATERGIALINAPHSSSAAVADIVLANITNLYRGIPYADETTRGGKWRKKELVGSEPGGKTLGVVGMGRIGREVASLAVAHGMRVKYFDPAVDVEIIGGNLPVTKVGDLETLFAESDVVSLHVPGEARGLIKYDHLRRLRRGTPAIFINTSRGETVEEGALEKALEDIPNLRAYVDVYPRMLERECDKPLARFYPRVILTPHIAGSTAEAQQKAADEIARQFLNYFSYGICRNITNGNGLPGMPDELVPYFALSERLAWLAYNFLEKQMPERVEFTPYGELGRYGEALLRGITKGILRNATSINARAEAEKAGILPLARAPHTHIYGNALTVDLVGKSDNISLRGSVDDEGCSLRRIGPHRKAEHASSGRYDYGVRVPLDGYVVILEFEDAVGAWEAAGKLAADHGLNIVHGSQQASYDRKKALITYVVEGEEPERIIRDIKSKGLEVRGQRRLEVYRAVAVKF